MKNYIDFNPNINYREELERLTTKTEINKLIRHYEYVNRQLQRYGAKGHNVEFSAYLDYLGFTPSYSNVTSKEKFYNYTLEKLDKFFSVNKDRVIKIGDESYKYGDILNQYIKDRDYNKFYSKLKELQKNDPSYQSKKKDYYKY